MILRYFRGRQFDFITCWCCYLPDSKEASFSFLFEGPEIIFPNMRFSIEMQKQPLEHHICIIHILPEFSFWGYYFVFSLISPSKLCQLSASTAIFSLCGGLSLARSLIFLEDENTYRQREAGLCSKHCILALLALSGSPSILDFFDFLERKFCGSARFQQVCCIIVQTFASCKYSLKMYLITYFNLPYYVKTTWR